jgi:hypothetical protein
MVSWVRRGPLRDRIVAGLAVQRIEDAAGETLVFDQGDEAHRAVAARAGQNVEVVCSSEEAGPDRAARNSPP